MKTEIWHLHLYLEPLRSTLLKHLWQRLQPWVFLGLTLQVWHTYNCGVSPNLLYRSSQALSGWMGSVAAQLFSGISRVVRLESRPEPGWATWHSETYPEANPTLSWLCAYGCCLVGRWTFAPSLRSWALWRRFSSRISLYFAPFIFPSILTSLSVTAAEKHPHSMMLPPMLHRSDGARFPPDVTLDIQSKEFNLGFIRPENLVSHGLRGFRCLLAISKWAVMCLLLRSSFRLATTIKAWSQAYQHFFTNI